MITFLLTTMSCQIEEDTIASQTTNTSFKVKRINETEISNFPKALEKIKAINSSSKSKRTTSKIVNDTILDIIIDTNEAILIEDENYTSLTFPIFRSNSNDFENLVVYTTDDVTNTYIVNYGNNLNSTINGQNNIASITQISFDTSSLNNRIEIRNTVTTLYSNEYGSLNYYCEETWEINTEYGYMDVANPSTGEDSENLINSNCYHMYTFNISNGGGGLGGGTSNNHGQLGSSTAGGSVTTSPITTTMEIQIVKDFVKNLSIEQFAWWTNPDNASAVASISNYLIQMNANSVFAIEFINSSINSGLNLDFEKSIKSPANIDFTEIDTTMTEGLRFNCIYNKLMQSQSFKNLFLNTFGGPQTKLNVKFKIVESLPNPSTNGDCQLVLDNNNSYTNLIRIKKEILSQTNGIGHSSNIKIAKIIIHELMHAYLNIKMINCNQGASLPTINNLELGELIQLFYDNFNCHIEVNGSPQSQHDFMYAHLVSSFQAIFNETRDLLISQANIDYANSLNFSNPSLNINESWIWNKFFKYITLNGLHQCDSFFQATSSDPIENFFYQNYMSMENQVTKNCF